MLLLIPGPVTTRPEVRAALAHDFAPWDRDFAVITEDVRARLHRVAGGVAGEHAVLILQGSGHFAVEASLRSFVARGARVLIPMTGQYAERMARLAHECGRVVVALPVPYGQRIDPSAVAAALHADPAITHVAFVYSETSTGIIHDAAAIGAVVRAAGRRVVMDAVSAFGALPLDLAQQPEIDTAAFTANKCLEGIPGLCFAAVRIDRLLACAGQAESWSFDLADAYDHTIVRTQGFRFTPPAQALNALRVALDLFDQEGGRQVRLDRYTANMDVLHAGLADLGFAPYLSREVQGPIVVNVLAPDDPAWNLQSFVDALKARGVLISNFYNTRRPSFRVGCIGALGVDEMRFALGAMGDALDELGIRRGRIA